jgi:HD-GYP domain-containing protein (c-di-GMP phosphodiesterase class II)
LTDLAVEDPTSLADSAEVGGDTARHELGQPELKVRQIRLAAKLHDIGKTAIPAAILDKPGPLDQREWEFIRRHPAIGVDAALAELKSHDGTQFDETIVEVLCNNVAALRPVH